MTPVTRKPASISSTSGFTLIEVLASISILLLLATGLAAAGHSGMRAGWKSREAAMRTVHTLRRARWRAISENLEYGVIFSRPSPGGPWEMLLARKNGSWSPVETPVAIPSSTARLAVTGSLIKEFNPDGTCSTGSVILTRPGGCTYRISLTSATGRVRLYREGS
jgi:prepilin-type N-terminal cleavage/methylation domain-containing protein